MLVAGACADNPPAFGGAFAFIAGDSPSWVSWDDGSANMLFAGASAANTPARGGALAFLVIDTPSDSWWAGGSAEKTYRSILFLV